MKTKSFLLTLSVLITLSLSISIDAFGQRHGPPAWAPIRGYRASTRHIYFPEYKLYYDIQRGSYIYLDNGQWVVNVNLPARYRAERLRNAPFVELAINSNVPQTYYMERRASNKSYKHVGYYNDNRNEYRRENRRNDRKENRQDNRNDEHRQDDNRR